MSKKQIHEQQQREADRPTRADAQAAIHVLQNALNQPGCCPEIIMGAMKFAVAQLVVSHSWTPQVHKIHSKLCDDLGKWFMETGGKTYSDMLAMFQTFVEMTTALAERIMMHDETLASAPVEHRTLEKFAAKIGEKLQTANKDGVPLPRPVIGTNSSFICTSEDPKRLLFRIECVNPFVANSVEDMVGSVLSPVPEARTFNEQGHTVLGFTFNPENPEAVRWVLKLKDQPGNAIQLPLQPTVVN